MLGLQVAGLPVWLDARRAGVELAAPPSYASFVLDGNPSGGLLLRLRDGHPDGVQPGWRALRSAADGWELYRDTRGRYLFRSSPDRFRYETTVDAGFGLGEVSGDFRARQGALFPLEGTDGVLYINWLAESGDLTLHASAVACGGVGYCFAGASGAGKSTLLTAFERAGSVTLLGEDSIVLRRVDGRFWIYGTPWHDDPARCSPAGAPLRRLYFLDRENGYGVRLCTPVEGVARLMQTALVPFYRPEAVGRILENLARLAEQVPFFTLGYELGSDPLRLLHE